MNKELVTDEYQSLIDDCKATIVEGVYLSNWKLIETYHLVGARIRQNCPKPKEGEIRKDGIVKLLSRVTVDLNTSVRTLYRAVQLFDLYPSLDILPGGKNMTWHRICNNLLPEAKKEKQTPLPEGKFNIILADPAWQYWEGGEKNQSQHYGTMTIDEISNLPIQNIAADDCILFLWATFPILPEQLEVIKKWGFDYSTIGFVWVKSKQDGTGFAFGCGGWTRANAEICIIATKGSIKRQDASISQIIYEPKREHSRKPDIVRKKIIQLVGDLPRIELFAREEKDGFVVWGNETDKFNDK